MNRPCILAALLTALAVPALATTIPAYVPGGAPCDGACGYEWALGVSGAPRGEPHRMIVPAGAVAEGMAYAKDGKPYWTTRPMRLSVDEAGRGYAFARDGHTFWMVQLDACANWSVWTFPDVGDAQWLDRGDWPKPTPVSQTWTPPITGYTPPVVTADAPPDWPPVVVIPPPVVPPVTPPAVPLPAAGVLLLSALYMMRRIT